MADRFFTAAPDAFLGFAISQSPNFQISLRALLIAAQPSGGHPVSRCPFRFVGAGLARKIGGAHGKKNR